MDIDDDHRVQRVILSDGSAAWGEPWQGERYTAEQARQYAANAAEDGYGGDVWRACVEHDATHQWLAGAMGYESSLSLWLGGHPGLLLPRGYVPREDAIVRWLQRWLNGASLPDEVACLLWSYGLAPSLVKRDLARALGR